MAVVGTRSTTVERGPQCREGPGGVPQRDMQSDGERTGSTILTVVLMVAAMVVVLEGLKLGAPVLGPIFLSVFFAIILTPVLKWFTRRGMSYRWALVLTLTLIAALGVALIAFLVITLIELKDQILSYESSFAQTADLLNPLFQFLSSSVRLTQVTAVLLDGVFVLFGTLFLLFELPRLHSSMVARLGADHVVVRGAEELYGDVIDYFIVRIKINFYTSIGAVAVLLLLGVDYALLWGLLAFALSFDAEGRAHDLAEPYPGGNLFSLASGGAIYVRDPMDKVGEDQLNGGRIVKMGENDWELLLPYLRENEALFGISIENDLLMKNGSPVRPEEIYKKVEVVPIAKAAPKVAEAAPEVKAIPVVDEISVAVVAPQVAEVADDDAN